jgi:hypothetical protein
MNLRPETACYQSEFLPIIVGLHDASLNLKNRITTHEQLPQQTEVAVSMRDFSGNETAYCRLGLRVLLWFA